MLNQQISYYVKILLLLFVLLLNLFYMSRKRIKRIETVFGYAPVHLNFDCFLIYAVSQWILCQLRRRELEHEHSVVIEQQTLHSFVCNLAHEMYYFTYDFYCLANDK